VKSDYTITSQPLWISEYLAVRVVETLTTDNGQEFYKGNYQEVAVARPFAWKPYKTFQTITYPQGIFTEDT